MDSFRSRVQAERPYLLRYASLQLRGRHAAEDVVQETLLAALAGEAGFGGRSNLRPCARGLPRAAASEDGAGFHDARAPWSALPNLA